MTVYMKPSDICYSQNSIRSRFHDNKTLWDLASDVIYDRVKVENVPVIRVKNVRGHWYVFKGNRRLFVYKKLAEFGVLSHIPVERATACGWLTITAKQGVPLKIRDSPNLELFLNRLINHAVYDK